MIISRIRDLREDHDYTQAEIAEHLHISQPAYSYYETGDCDTGNFQFCSKLEQLVYADDFIDK